MILLLHRWELVQEAVLWATGEEEVTIVNSLPAAAYLARGQCFEMCLVDWDTHGSNIVNLARHAKVVALTADRSDKATKAAIRAGAVGVIWLGLPYQEIALELEKMRKRGSPEESKPLRWNQVMDIQGIPLGETQLRVLVLSTQGMTAPLMAERLGLGEGYINQVMNGLYKKFEVNDKDGFNKRVLLAVEAMKAGVMEVKI